MEFETIARLEEAVVEASRKGIVLEVRYEGIMLRSRKLINDRVYANDQIVPWHDVPHLKRKIWMMKTEPDGD